MALLDLIRFDKKSTRLQMKDAEDERKVSIQEFERLMEQFDREIAEFEIYKKYEGLGADAISGLCNNEPFP